MAADIDDGADLLRRIHPSHVVEDKNIGGKRPSSAAFKDPNMSVDVEPFLVQAGLDWTFTLKNYPGYSLVSFKAATARNLKLGVVHTPVPDNDAHAEVVGKKNGNIPHTLLAAAQVRHLAP